MNNKKIRELVDMSVENNRKLQENYNRTISLMSHHLKNLHEVQNTVSFTLDAVVNLLVSKNILNKEELESESIKLINEAKALYEKEKAEKDSKTAVESRPSS